MTGICAATFIMLNISSIVGFWLVASLWPVQEMLNWQVFMCLDHKPGQVPHKHTSVTGKQRMQESLIKDIQHNCDISDAKDHGVYSMCTMVLKLRNLYKWEKGLEPWQEPEPPDLLDWIDVKENYWEDIAGESFHNIKSLSGEISPYEPERINSLLRNGKVLYGAGFGRSMKSIFFLAEKASQYTVEGCPVTILSKELAKEMASPFAMAQDGQVIIRREPLRYFLWDQMQEMRTSCRSSVHHVLQSYGLQSDGQLDQNLLKSRLEEIVDDEINLFIYHEVGEILQESFDSKTLQKLISNFPGTVIELVCRGIKDVLADTHPKGLLAYIIREKRDSSLALYLAMLDGLRAKLFPEIALGWELFLPVKEWCHIEQARSDCWDKYSEIAETIRIIGSKIGSQADDQISEIFNQRVLLPIGIEQPG